MGKKLFYGCGVLGTAAVFVGCAMHNPIPTNIGFVLLTICIIISLFSKEKLGTKTLDKKMKQLISEVIQPNVLDTVKNIYTLMCLLEEDIDPCKITLKGTEVLPCSEDKSLVLAITSEVFQCASDEELQDFISFIIMKTNSHCKGLIALAQAVEMLMNYNKTFDV